MASAWWTFVSMEEHAQLTWTLIGATVQVDFKENIVKVIEGKIFRIPSPPPKKKPRTHKKVYMAWSFYVNCRYHKKAEPSKHMSDNENMSCFSFQDLNSSDAISNIKNNKTESKSVEKYFRLGSQVRRKPR